MDAVISNDTDTTYNNINAKNEYVRHWMNKKYTDDVEFRARAKVRYYKKRYGDEPMIKAILEQDITTSKQYTLIVQYLASKKLSHI